MDDCIFCQIIAGKSPATIVHEWFGAIAIVPLNPVVDGHLLVIPNAHVVDAIENPYATALAFRCAAEIAPNPCNLITSIGEAATQTIKHLHVHIVPRKNGDGLKLPWNEGL